MRRLGGNAVPVMHVPDVTGDALDFGLFLEPDTQLPPGFSKPDLGT